MNTFCTPEFIVIFIMSLVVSSTITNILYYVCSYRSKLKEKKKLPPNKTLADTKYEIVNVLEDVGMLCYAVVKYNLKAVDKLYSGSILSILCVFLIPYPVIRLKWAYVEEDSFKVTNNTLEKFQTHEDIVNFYDRLKEEKDTEAEKRNSLNEKINLINCQNGKR